MKKIFVVGILCISLLAFSFAGDAAFLPSNQSGHGVGGGITSVEQAKKLNDDAVVILEGYIEKHLRKDHYLFRDKTGSITVEIDEHVWDGLTITPKDMVRMRGEIDRDYFSIEVEIKHVEIVEKN